MAKNITFQSFIKKSNSTKISAIAFLEQYREWLVSNNIKKVNETLSKLDDDKISPDSALMEIRKAVFAYMMKKNDEKLEQQSNYSKSSKKFSAVIIDSTSKPVFEINRNNDKVPLNKSFDMPQDAERWVDRKLFDNANCIGIIECNNVHYSTINRIDSIARVLKPGRTISCKTVGKKQDSLSFLNHSKNYKTNFFL